MAAREDDFGSELTFRKDTRADAQHMGEWLTDKVTLPEHVRTYTHTYMLVIHGHLFSALYLGRRLVRASDLVSISQSSAPCKMNKMPLQH